jgi:hypothetical protein
MVAFTTQEGTDYSAKPAFSDNYRGVRENWQVSSVDWHAMTCVTIGFFLLRDALRGRLE